MRLSICVSVFLACFSECVCVYLCVCEYVSLCLSVCWEGEVTDIIRLSAYKPTRFYM